MRAPKRLCLAAVAAVALLPLGGLADPDDVHLPLTIHPRPFLLVEVPRRFSSTTTPEVRLQRRGSGPVRLVTYRVKAPEGFARGPFSPQGVAIAQTPYGAEAEALLAQDSPLPRDGALLTLVDDRTVMVQARARLRRTAGDEAALYDSNEADEGDVVTRFMGGGGWSGATARLPVLPPGVYLTRAVLGAWSSTALLSVGELTLLVRRGDREDRVLVTGPDGSPEGGVEVEVLHDGHAVARGRTDAHGAWVLPARPESTVRFLARSGQDLAWSDVTHAPLAHCDPRIYLATGRPTYRPGEDLHLRGHLRGCVGDREVPLPDEPIELPRDGSDEPLRLTTNADGDFTAVVPAARVLRAVHRGRVHTRTVRLDHAVPPEHPVELRIDRPWAAPGERVLLTVRDARGAWYEPARCTVTAPGFERSLPIGPAGPAVFEYTVPPSVEALTITTFAVAVTGLGGTARTTAELRTGASRELVEVDLPQRVGRPGQSVAVAVQVRDLGGQPVTGDVTALAYGSDGNRRGDGPRARAAATLDPNGRATIPLTLSGAGPWWIEAERPTLQGATARGNVILWDRPRPPTLNGGDSLAILPESLNVTPGTPLRFALRTPTPGAMWVTLEQSGVVSDLLLPAGVLSGELPVPDTARGRATLAATRLHGGEAETVTSVLDVATAPYLSLRVSSERTVYAPGATARVTVDTADAEGHGRDAVVTLWAAEEGWWALNPEEHPAPRSFLSLPGRAASAGDSTRPQGYGAEEGRRLDTLLEWNGRPLEGATFRHGWGHPTELVTLDSQGTFLDVARSLALRAGLTGAWVCPSAQVTPSVTLRARSLPWDLVAFKVAQATETHALVRQRTLRFECGPPPGDVGGFGSGSGRGMGTGGGGFGVVPRRALLGNFYFLPLRHTGPQGHLELEVVLPTQPGHWRIEALAIASDAASAQDHTELSTAQPMVVEARLPSPLRVGDEAEGSLVVTAPGLAGRSVPVRLTPEGPLTLLVAPGPAVTLGPDGVGRSRFRVRLTGMGDASLVAAGGGAGGPEDAARLPVVALEDPSVVPLAVSAVAGPSGAELHVPVPALRSAATVEVTVEGDLEGAARDVLDELRAPRWDVAILRVDRLLALDALLPVVQPFAALRDEVERARASELSHLERLSAPDGLLSPIGSVAPGTWFLLRQALALGEGWDGRAPMTLRQRVRALVPRGPMALDPELALVLARSRDGADRALALRVLQRVATPERPDGLLAAVQAATVVSPAEVPRRSDALAAWVERALSQDRGTGCAGPAWFLCTTRDGERGLLARSALALRRAGRRPEVVDAVLQRLSRPLPRQALRWGTAEADVLALVHALRGGQSPGSRVVVALDGVELGRGEASAGLRVSVPHGGALTVSVAPQASRFARVFVRGGLSVEPPTTSLGPAALRASVDASATVPTLVVQWTLTSAAEDLELQVPLPAGFALAAPPGRGPATASARARELSWWMPWETEGPDSVARVAYIDGAVRVRYGHLGAGAHRLRLPLTVAAEGLFHAGGGWLRARDPELWSLSPPLAP
ncbi:MAG: hypothetical protein HY909_05885 [Deltaproteobacteria bacterium]|nr:hypothetical protein [Deltaproteobacteria bacterium]